MAVCASLQLSLEFGISRNHGCSKLFRDAKISGQLRLLRCNSLPISLKRYTLRSNVLKRTYRRDCTIPCRNQQFRCHCFLKPSALNCVKNATLTIIRSFNHFQGSPLVIKLASSISIIIFAIWGLGPVIQLSRNILLQKSDNRWKKSSTYQVTTSYIQPLLLWAGAVLICRTLDPMILPTEAGQIVKQRLLNFVRSLSTVMAFAYCLSSAIQQAQKFFVEDNPNDTRNMGFQFAGKAVYTAVWVAAFSLFMELLGFSTQRWLTAGGLGTVLLTLAGREIFTNFLSSVMIHATRPFVLNEWIQTKIEGYEVSGTVEHVGWWSPTIIRAEDREAVYIPNHKFTVSVVRNLTQKSHWRIKTHLAISHLDVKKINSIVADMRKVLAKNPQVEQQKLHRRVFLDNINPENQALMVLISCFVKTSHLEEYLCVKEAILLDLLRVIRHHRARLATPIRTVQKTFTEAELGNVPFSDTVYDKGTATNLPVLLIEPSKINREDKTKNHARSSRAAGEEDSKPSTKPTQDRVHAKSQVIDGEADSEFVQMPKIEMKDDPSSISAKSSSDTKLYNSTKPPSKAADTSKSVQGASSDAVNSSGPVPKSSNSKNSQKVDQETTSVSSPGMGGTTNLKQDGRQQVTADSPTMKPSLEENLVLGVALEGSKRMLPIDEGDTATPSNLELATLHGGSGSGAAEKDKNDVKRSKSTGSLGNDQPLDHREE